MFCVSMRRFLRRMPFGQFLLDSSFTTNLAQLGLCAAGWRHDSLAVATSRARASPDVQRVTRVISRVQPERQHGMTANVVLGVQRAFRGRRLIIILLCTLVVLLVVVPLQLQHNVTNMLREKAVELGSEVHWPTSFPHFGAPPFEEQGMALDLEDAARRPPAAHEDPGRTTRCEPGWPVSDAKGAVRHVVQYALMLDAGSTGSRIHVYKFNYCAAKPELESEVFRHVEPGLSSYKADSRGAANSLRPLLDEAVRVIPEPLRRCSPVQLKATAGLRLLPGRQSQEIIQAVRELLEKEYPFPIADGVDASGRRDTRGVEIMKGREEGVFAWIAVNYLLNLIGSSGNLPSVEHKDSSGHVRKTAAVLDLGGGSTQIVFEPQMPPPHKAMQPGEHVYELHGMCYRVVHDELTFCRL